MTKTQFSLYNVDVEALQIIGKMAKKEKITRNKLMCNIIKEVAKDLVVTEQLDAQGILLNDRIIYTSRYFKR